MAEEYVSNEEQQEVEVESNELEAPTITNAVVKQVPTMEEGLSDLGEALSKEEEEMEFTPDDIKKSIKDSMFVDDDKFQISDEDTLKLLEIVNKVKAKEKVNIYNELPESVQAMINKYMIDNGVQGFSVQSNSIRNTLSATLIDEFISNISVDKTVESFNKEMEDLFINTGEEFSKMYKEYDSERTKYLESALEKIPEGPEGEEKRKTIEKVLDSINDSYKLTRLKEASGKLKIKNFEKEKPEKVFSDFEFKYRDKTYHIYPIKTALKTLANHLEKRLLKEFDMNQTKAAVAAGIESITFMLLFCKFCRNYKASVPEEHAFMYYTLYNIMLLDIYKGTEYEEFAGGLINNIIDSYKPYYKKTMTEEAYKQRFGE